MKSLKERRFETEGDFILDTGEEIHVDKAVGTYFEEDVKEAATLLKRKMSAYAPTSSHKQNNAIRSAICDYIDEVFGVIKNR